MPVLDRLVSRLTLGGMVVWLVLLAVPLAAAPGAEEEAMHLVLLAPTVLVPLFVLAAVPASFGPAPAVLRVAVWLLGPGALGTVASAVVPAGALAGALAALWLLPTGLLAFKAVADAGRRWRETTLDAAEVLVTAGWVALPVGAAGVVLARSGAQTGLDPFAMLLMTGHILGTGAILPLWSGLLGRSVGASGWRRWVASLLLTGLWGLTAGVVLSGGLAPSASVVAPGILLALAASGVGIAGVVWAGRVEERATGLMLAVSGGTLVLAMVLAAWFTVGLGRSAEDVAWMVERYGWLTAFFALWGGLGWRRLRPRPAAA
ncbi:MAG: YndJ family transporter [Bacteroidota bacterium]